MFCGKDIRVRYDYIKDKIIVRVERDGEILEIFDIDYENFEPFINGFKEKKEPEEYFTEPTYKIIAVDFDGTLCTNEYPKIGKKIQATFDYLFEEINKGAKIILWTCRSGDLLLDAVKWCDENGLIFDAVNENLKECIDKFGGDTRKIYADEYIDDKNKHICTCKNGCRTTSKKTSDIHEEKQPDRVINSNTYIEYVKRTSNSYLSTKEQLTNGLMGLTGESGEALDILKKTLFQDHPLDREKIALELGDVMWYLTLSADIIGYTLNDILKMNVEKLERRYPDGFMSENSINRKE